MVGATSLSPPRSLPTNAKLSIRGKASKVSSWSCSVRDNAVLGSASSRNEHDRNCLNLLLKHKQRAAASRYDHIGLQVDKIRHLSPQAVEVVTWPAGVDVQVPALDPAQAPQDLATAN